ncbi:MAG: TetR/AcrR family transcriptional regulator, partial [Myxococcota bacterium]
MGEDPTKRPRGRPKSIDRQRTVEAAMQEYWRDGVEHLSINTICKRLEVSKPTLYREFGSEDGLLEAVLDCYFAAVLEPTLRKIEEPRPFREILGELLDWITSNDQDPPGCLFADMRTTRGRLGPATSERVASLQDVIRQGYAAWYQRGLDRSEVSPRVSAEL